MRDRVLWIQLDGPHELPLRRGPVPVVVEGHVAQCGASFGERRLELQCPLRRGPRSRKRLGGGPVVVEPQNGVGVAQSHVRPGVVRIQPDRPLEVANRLLQVLTGASVAGESALEVGVLCLRGARLAPEGDRLGRELDPERPRDGLGQLLLDLEHVHELSVVGL